MDTLPLPPRPDLEQYRKRAKALVAAARSKDPAAVNAWTREWLKSLAKSLDVEITPFVQHSFDRALEQIDTSVRERVSATGKERREFALADAQFLIAQAHSFESWAAFATHVERGFGGGSKDRAFEAAADAVVGGDLETLQALIAEQPELIRARSARVHRATLLHYVAANGVEDFRQKTPPNAVAIAKFLLDAGAEVDAVAGTYGGDLAQTTMNLLVSSTHPADAGVQSALVEVLLDHGAAINGLEDNGSPLMTAIAFWYGDAAETLARRGARIGNVVAAASVGREDLVRRYVVDRVTLSPDVGYFETPWFSTPRDPKAHIEMAFASACHFRRAAIAEFFLESGVDVAAKDKDDMTPLHWAAANGMVELIDVLIDRGAPLEAMNRWDGTVLDSTAHFAYHSPFPDVDYAAVFELLIARGANADVLREYPPGNSVIDRFVGR